MLAAMDDFIPAVLVEKTIVLRNVLRPRYGEILKLLNVTGLTEHMQQAVHANTQLGHAYLV
jgi:hypothetical protein